MVNQAIPTKETGDVYGVDNTFLTRRRVFGAVYVTGLNDVDSSRSDR
jgi:hypothetical protein